MNKVLPVTRGVAILALCFAAGSAYAQSSAALPPKPETNRPSAPPTVTAPDTGGIPRAGNLGHGPALPARPFSITRSDPALDDIIAPDAKLELLNDEFGLIEGPVWVPEGNSGYLLFVDMLSNVIYKMTPDKKVSVFLYKAGYSGDDIFHAGIQTWRGRVNALLIGPEAVTRDPQGRVVWCASNDGAIMRLEKDDTRTIIANNYQGKRFNGPNDLTIKSDGAIYFTDVDTGLRDGAQSPLKELPFTGIYMVKDDKVTLLLDSTDLGGSPNGIVLSPDEKYIYLNVGKKLMRYEVKSDDTLGEGILFSEGDGIGDGIKVDKAGNVYSAGGAGPGEVRIMAPDGKLLGLLNMPLPGTEPKREICALNVAFGGVDAKTLYIAGCEALFRIPVKTAGVIPGPAQ